MIFFNDCENIILTDSKNFINNNIQINTISFNKESDNFSLTITEELKEIFN